METTHSQNQHQSHEQGPTPPQSTLPNHTSAPAENPERSYLVALLLSYLLGGLGIDRFYLNKTGTGILKLLTLGGLGVWQIIDLLLIALNKLHAKGDDRPLQGYAQNRAWVKMVAIVIIIVHSVALLGIVLVFSLAFLTAPKSNTNQQTITRQNDVSTTAGSLNEYRETHKNYPTKQEFYDGTFRIEGGLSELKQSDLHYNPQPDNCDNVRVTCTSYTIGTKMPDGSEYTVNQ